MPRAVAIQRDERHRQRIGISFRYSRFATVTSENVPPPGIASLKAVGRVVRLMLDAMKVEVPGRGYSPIDPLIVVSPTIFNNQHAF